MQPGPHEVTHLLRQARGGDRQALDRLLPLVYDELRALAHRQRARHRPYETLNTTALVHEAYARLTDRPELDAEDRAHFFGLAARAMRDVLVDYARARRAAKRGGDRPTLPLDLADDLPDRQLDEILGVDEALRRLERLDARAGRVVELRYFGGFSIPETADLLGVSEATVRRDWTAARAWLYNALTG
jgi:RNA polymerase sigma factor (TIGR02999 family)